MKKTCGCSDNPKLSRTFAAEMDETKKGFIKLVAGFTGFKEVKDSLYLKAQSYFFRISS